MRMQADAAESATADGLSLVWSRVAAFASAVDARLDKWLTLNHRVGLTEFRALALVSQTSAKEMRVNVLAEKVGLNQSSATRLVSRLEAKGLARRDLCEDDGRGVYAVITEQGEELVRDVRPTYDLQVRALLEQSSTHFPQVDVAQLSQALKQVDDHIPQLNR